MQDDQRVAWLRQLVEWQQDMRDPGEFMSTLKARPLSGRSLLLHAERPRHRAARRRHSHRFRLCRSLRSRQYLRRRQSQRPHRAAAVRPAQRRCCRYPDQAGHQPSKDWLSHRQDLPRPQQNQAHHQRQRARARHRDRPEVSGKGSAAPGCADGANPEATNWNAWPREYGLGKTEDLYASSATASSPRARCCRNASPEQVPEEPAPPPVAGAADAVGAQARTTTTSSKCKASTT